METETNTALDAATGFFASSEFYTLIAIPLFIIVAAAIAFFSFTALRRKRDKEILESPDDGKQAPADPSDRTDTGWVVPDRLDAIKEGDDDQGTDEKWELSPETAAPAALTPEEAAAEAAEAAEEAWVTEPAAAAEDDEDAKALAGDSVETPAEAASVESAVAEIKGQDRGSWLHKLRSGLSKTREQLGSSLRKTLLGKVKLDAETMEELQHLLYRADIGVQTSDNLVENLQKNLGAKDIADVDAIKKTLKTLIEEIFAATPTRHLPAPAEGPLVILVVGVNGVGKTTSIGKLAANFRAQGKSVLLCAGDTFRAAAIDQLKIWGERTGIPVIAHQPGADPAAVAYDAVKAAIARKAEVLLIDTAGRLHNKNDLMQELNKINRIIGRDLPGAPHETWLVIDATTGQNAFHQVKSFQEVVSLTGLVLTKLDGTAKGGVAVGLVDQFKVPIRYIGVGEKASDLQEFSSDDYAASLLDL